jgi:hypothetical protein
MPVTVEVYRSGLTEVYDGGTVPTSSRIALTSRPGDRELGLVRAIAQGVPVLVIGASPPEPDDDWPPSWFGSIQSARTDTSARTEEILRAELGRNDHR